MGQHMVQSALQGTPVQPMSVRDSAWAIYRIYDTAEGGHVFVGITTDETWARFCAEFGREDLAARRISPPTRDDGPTARSSTPKSRQCSAP